MAKKSKINKSNQKHTIFQRLSLAFFMRPRRTAIIWIFVAVFGALSYTTLLKREGFPAIATPFAIAQGSYLVNDPAKVDSDVAKPLGEFILKQPGVKSVQSQSFDNYYTTMVSYNEDVNAEARSTEIQKAVTDQKILPNQATAKIEAFKLGYTTRGDDMVISLYADKNNVSTKDLSAKATEAVNYLKTQNIDLAKDISVIDPYESATNPLTGASEVTQKSFDRFGKREGDTNKFYDTIVIGVTAKDGADELELNKQALAAVDALNKSADFEGYTTEISGSNAPLINTQIGELQKTLLEGLLAVLIVGSIVIAWRASVITVISMITVISIVIGFLYLIGYSLNTITLFGLILGLSLIVDDTIIMIEAIDAQRRKRKDPKEIVEVASGKVGQAMIAATSTAALSFAPLLFVGGIIGSFIKAIPITIIAALVISLIVALVFIPLFARFLLLGKNQVGNDKLHDEPAAGIEAAIARFLSTPMLWAQHSKKKLLAVGLCAVIIGFGFIGAGGALFSKVKFSIFPADKDSNQISVVLTYQPGTSIEQAEDTVDKADKIIGDTLGDNFVKAAYYGQATVQTATLSVDIIDYSDRTISAPQLSEELNKKFENFEGADVKAQLLGVGPPESAFTVKIDSSQNRDGAVRLGEDIATFLSKTELKRPDGSIAKIELATPPSQQTYTREGSYAYVQTTAKFADTDTSALVTLAQAAVEKEFPKDKIATYGVSKDALNFDFGQESENQDSFKTLALAFPILLAIIYVVLAFQFRSLLQPLLIFMAIPFSIFGITLGLYLTNNPFSFFAMLGFFALIGLSIKNTILLTDYANQARKAGKNPIDAAHDALAERFRPLIATSLTAVFSLIPLAITSPFWEGLAVVLIFGLLSSTFLVVTVFPYYYLGAEYLRSHINRRTGLSWIILTAAIGFGLAQLAGAAVIAAPFLAAIVIAAIKKYSKR